MQKLLLFSFFIFFSFISSQSAGQIYETIGDGNWTESNVWKDGNIPPFNGGLSKKSQIFVNHNVSLDGDFNCNSASLGFFVGYENPQAYLVITGDFIIQQDISLVIYHGATLQVGVEPEDENFDFCFIPFDSNDLGSMPEEMSLFYVRGSNELPSLTVHNEATFLLYGNFLVENNFEINVETGGNFIIKGGFEANNNAHVELAGAGGDIGCSMIFKNDASIVLDGGELNVGGDLLFGNGGSIYLMNGSIINVDGEICSGPGQGSAFLNISGDGSSQPPNIVNYGSLCATVQIEEGVLPVELLSFSYEIVNNSVILYWTTASETSNDYFTVERTTNFNSWYLIGNQQGAGNSSDVIDYSMKDESPLVGIAYYRLRQTDFNGDFKYFAPLAVSYIPGEVDVKVRKSPDTWIVYLPDDDEYKLEVFSLMGEKLFSASGIGEVKFPSPQKTFILKVYKPGGESVFSEIFQ